MLGKICGVMDVEPAREWMIPIGGSVSDTGPKLLGWAGDLNASGT